MEIIGRGFLARNHAPIGHRHPRVILIAAGASSTYVSSPEAFERESALVRDVLARCRREDKTAVFFSTASHAMYGCSDEPLDEDRPLLPAMEFGRHKYGLESMVAESGARWLTVRLSHAVGRGQRPHQFFPGIVSYVRSGSIRVFRGGHRDLIDVEDAVRAVDALLERGVHGEVVNVASGATYPVERIVRAIEEALDVVTDTEIVDAEPIRTPVSVEKLRRLVPDHYWPTRGDEYLKRIVGKYAASY